MSMIKRLRPENRLRTSIRQPGGRLVTDIEADIESRFAVMRENCACAMQEEVAEIVRLSDVRGQAPSAPQLQAIYRLASEVVGLSGVADLPALGSAALSFCRLVDGFRCGKPWNWAVFKVHVTSLQLLAQSERTLADASKAAVIAGLEDVVGRSLQ